MRRNVRAASGRGNIAVLALALAGGAARAEVINVSGGGANLQAAINIAQPGDVLRVAQGTYSPIATSNKAIRIESIFPDPRWVIIEGGNTRRCAMLGEPEEYEYVGYLTATNTVLSGFTLRYGKAVSTGGDDLSGGGGGALGGTLTNCIVSFNTADIGGGACLSVLTDCTIIGNEAEAGGGACISTLTGCDLSHNTAVQLGGGAYGSQLLDCDLEGNSAGIGGGAGNCTLTGCTLTGNEAETGGGGAFLSYLLDCDLEGNTAYYGGGVCGSYLLGCTLTGNAAEHGGGAYGGEVDNWPLECSLLGCTLAGNTAGGTGGGATGCNMGACVVTNNTAWHGGGAWDCSLQDSLVAWNTAGDKGGGAVRSHLLNCTVTRNSAINAGGVAGACQVENTIVHGNQATSEPEYEAGAGSVFMYSFSASAPPGVENKGGNPLFADAAGGDFRLQPGSPCRNTGNNALAAAGYGHVEDFLTDMKQVFGARAVAGYGAGRDLDGKPRVIGGTADMGAYEFGSALSSLRITRIDLGAVAAGRRPVTLDLDYTGALTPLAVQMWRTLGSAPDATLTPPVIDLGGGKATLTVSVLATEAKAFFKVEEQ